MDPPGNRHIVSCMRGSDNGMPTVISTDLKIAGNTEANERAARRGTADVMNGPPWEPPHCLMHARLRQWHANCNKYEPGAYAEPCTSISDPALIGLLSS